MNRLRTFLGTVLMGLASVCPTYGGVSAETMLKTRSVGSGLPFSSGAALDSKLTFDTSDTKNPVGTFQIVEFADLKLGKVTEHDFMYTTPSKKLGPVTVTGLFGHYDTRLIPNQQEIGVIVSAPVGKVDATLYVGHMPTKGWGHGEVFAGTISKTCQVTPKLTVTSDVSARNFQNYFALGNGFSDVTATVAASYALTPKVTVNVTASVPLKVADKFKGIAMEKPYAGLGVKVGF